MSIPGNVNIRVGLPNQSANSDGLYTAFNKINTNFNTLFGNASPYNTFTAGPGISTNANPNSGVVTVTNTGVTSIIAGTGIVIDQANGNVTISSTGGNGNGGGTVTSIGILANSSRINVSSSTSNPIVSNGNFTIDLANSGVSPGVYTNPSTVTVDNWGRVTSIASGLVTSIGLTSNTLTVTNSPVIESGTMNIELPANVTVSGRFRLSGSEDLANGANVNLSVTSTYFSTSAAENATLGLGTEGQIKTFMMYADSGDMVVTVINAGWKTTGNGTMTFDTIGDGCTLQFVNNKWFCVGNNGVVFA